MTRGKCLHLTSDHLQKQIGLGGGGGRNQQEKTLPNISRKAFQSLGASTEKPTSLQDLKSIHKQSPAEI